MCTGFVGFGLARHASFATLAITIQLKLRNCVQRACRFPGKPVMNVLTRTILFTSLVVLSGHAAYAQTLITDGNAPAAEAAGAADAANRKANGGNLKAGRDDTQLLGGPDAYGDVYQNQTDPAGIDPRQPAGGANGQGQGAAPVGRTINAPQQNGNAKLTKAGAQAGGGNAALQLYGDGTATGATRHEVYKSPW